LAEKIIRDQNVKGLFFVFNSDVICEYPLDKLVQFHLNHGKQGTIVVTQVEDPSKYGVVIAKENGEIERFVEKPTTFVSDKINAGLYLFHTDMIDRIPLRPCSIEREIFP
jgi:mannose-1-phosphate guanylyltransferase